MPVKLKCGSYVEYLDKEMTIMGVLSAFCVLVAAFTLERTMAAQHGTSLARTWETSAVLVAAGAASALWGCFKFYLQRSLLAWYYGQLVLYETRDDMEKVDELLTDADAWDSWLQYRLGFLWLYVSFVFIALSVARDIVPIAQNMRQRYIVVAVVVVALTYAFVTKRLLHKYRLEDDSPWTVWWRKLKR